MPPPLPGGSFSFLSTYDPTVLSMLSVSGTEVDATQLLILEQAVMILTSWLWHGPRVGFTGGLCYCALSRVPSLEADCHLLRAQGVTGVPC